MKVISSKDDDLLSQFGNIKENDFPILERLANLPPQNRSTPHHKMLIITTLIPTKAKLKEIYI